MLVFRCNNRIKWPLALVALWLGCAMNSTAQVPGGEGADLRFWIKSDDGPDCIIPDCSVSEWEDRSGGNNHLRQNSSSQKPIFKDNSVNYNPGVLFDGVNDRMSAEIADDTTDFTFFCVGQLDANTVPQGTFFHNRYTGAGNGDYNSFQLDSDGNTFRYRNQDEVLLGPYTSDFIILAITNTDQNSGGNTLVNAYRNELITNSEVFAGENRGQLFDDYAVGSNRIGNSYLKGYISEIVLYSRILDPVAINKVESYLAVKYGITLGVNGTSLNYHSSLGTRIWDIASNAGYNSDIAGIGRDDQSGLMQKQSKSIYDRDVVLVGIGGTLHSSNLTNPNTFATNDSYFLWGHNGAALTCSGFDSGTTENGDFIIERMDREWKAQETGTIDLTAISFDMSLETLGDLATSDYKLLVDEDGIFSSGAISIDPTQVDLANERLFFHHDFVPETGYYFTIGITGVPAALDGDTTICSGDSAPLDIHYPAGGGPIDLVITDGINAIPVNNAPDGYTLDVAPPQTTVYYLQYFDDELCNGSLIYDSVTITVHPLPEPMLPADTAVCTSPFALDATFPGAGYTWQDGSTDPVFNAVSDGIYWVDVAVGNCVTRDSVVLDLLSAGITPLSITLCPGDSATIDGVQYYTAAGSYTDTLAGSICDSIVTLSLDFVNTAANPLFITLCQGDSITVNGADYYSNPGVYIDTLSGILCDSIVTLNLSFNSFTSSAVSASICQGDSATINGMDYFLVPGVYVDTLSGGSCDSVVQLTLSVDAPLSLDLGADTNLCSGSFALDVSIPGGSYLWQDGSTGAVFTIDSGGAYWVTVTPPTNCPEVTDTIVVSEGAISGFDLPDLTLCIGDNAFVSAPVEADNYLWSTGSTSQSISIDQEGSYWLAVQNECGSAADSFEVAAALCYCDALAPLAFTPNGDGTNDLFRVYSACDYAVFRLEIYNRWGQSVFSTNDPLSGWDGRWKGKMQEMDEYAWILQFAPVAGGLTGDETTISGTVLLLK